MADLEKLVDELARLRVDHDALKDEVTSTSRDRPGLSLRIARIELLLDTAWKAGGALGGLAILWKIAEVFVRSAGGTTP